jgi:hypothetical protein
MSAAVAGATVPLYLEGTKFWQELTDECREHVEAINRAVSAQGLSPDERVELMPGDDIYMRKRKFPSTRVEASLGLFSWGPVIRCKISGARDCDHHFLTYEFEMPIARDGDGKTVAIFDEGRSFSPREVACYLTQSFRRCFPSATLPCG